MTDITPPEARITIQYKGEDKEVFMSQLRLNSCLRIVGTMDRVASMMIDPDIGEGIIRALVAPKGGAGRMFDVELEDEDVLPEDWDQLLNFARDHITYFFVKRLQGASENAATLESMVRALRPSAAGSDPSSGSGASAGPSA